MADGWIKLHRKMRDWQHYQRPSVRLVFEELLFCANTKVEWFHGIKVNRGETMVSIETICDYTGFSRATVVAALKILEETKEIKRSKCWRGTRTKIINFDKYQDNASSESSIESSSTSSSISSIESSIESSSKIKPQKESSSKIELQTELLIEPQTELLTIPEQEIKKEKKDKNNIILSSPNGEESVCTDPPIPNEVKSVVDFWNKSVSGYGAVMPKVRSASGKRATAIKARIREFGLEVVYEVISKACQSDFMNGKNNRGWTANFDWIFLPTNFQKVLEGNYDNKTNQIQNESQYGRNFTTQSSGYYHTGDEGREQRATKVAATIASRLAESAAREAAIRNGDAVPEQDVPF